MKEPRIMELHNGSSIHFGTHVMDLDIQVESATVYKNRWQRFYDWTRTTFRNYLSRLYRSGHHYYTSGIRALFRVSRR